MGVIAAQWKDDFIDQIRFKYRSHPYDIGFAISFEKTQSNSFKRLILDVQLWPKMSLTAERVLVGLSRVETLEHLRILPYGPSQNQNHCLKPYELVLHWMAGFNESGFWSVKGSAQSIQKHPLTSKLNAKQFLLQQLAELLQCQQQNMLKLSDFYRSDNQS